MPEMTKVQFLFIKTELSMTAFLQKVLEATDRCLSSGHVTNWSVSVQNNIKYSKTTWKADSSHLFGRVTFNYNRTNNQ